MSYYWWGALVWCAWCASDYERDRAKYSIGVLTTSYIVSGLIWPLDSLVWVFTVIRRIIRNRHDTP